VRTGPVILCLAAVLIPGLRSLTAQEVVSARSGVVHFVEGSVFLDNQALDRKSGAFPVIKDGATLRTERGRAEILLMPGSFLRLDDNSSVRLISGALANTKIEFLTGVAIFEVGDSSSDKAMQVIFKDSHVSFPQSGVYRIDADTGILQAYSGEAEVSAENKTSHVDSSHLFFFTLNLETEKLDAGTQDEFYDWARDRSQEISEENQLNAQNIPDPGDIDPDPSAIVPPGPYFGGGSSIPAPSIPSYSGPSYPSLPGGYTATSPLMNPFLSFTSGPFVPYAGFPMLVLVRQIRQHAGSPTSTGTRVWRPVPIGVSHWPSPPTSLSYRPITGASTIRTYRPAYVRPSGVGVSRPVVVPARSISAPAVHAIGRR